MNKPFSPIDLFNDGLYSIKLSEEVYSFFGCTESSFNVVPSRIMGLSYPSFVRFARDNFNAILGGQSIKYITLKFKERKDCQALCDVLNKRWSELVN